MSNILDFGLDLGFIANYSLHGQIIELFNLPRCPSEKNSNFINKFTDRIKLTNFKFSVLVPTIQNGDWARAMAALTAFCNRSVIDGLPHTVNNAAIINHGGSASTIRAADCHDKLVDKCQWPEQINTELVLLPSSRHTHTTKMGSYEYGSKIQFTVATFKGFGLIAVWHRFSIGEEACTLHLNIFIKREIKVVSMNGVTSFVRFTERF